MKNYIKINGKTIELSEESVNNIMDVIQHIAPSKPKERLMSRLGDVVYLPDMMNNKVAIWRHSRTNASRLDDFESLNKKTIERAAMWIKLQNFADEVNDEEGGRNWAICWSWSFGGCIVRMASPTSEPRFTSKSLAQEAIEYFGEDFFRKLFNVPKEDEGQS